MKYIFLFSVVFLVFFFSCQNNSNTKYSADGNLRDIELGEALKMMKQEGFVTIDIRTPEEITKGKILDSALEMDFYADDFQSKLEALDKEGHYVVYCRSGGRSGKTLKTMKEMGFKNAYNVLGGYNAYLELNK